MNPLFSKLFLTTLSITIFTGCISTPKPALACYKGSTSCFTQQNIINKNDCIDCVVIL